MKVYYWCPYLSKVATIKAVLNSCKCLNKTKGFDAKIVNVIGEWDHISKKYRLDLLTNFKIYKFIPKKGYFYSRFSSILIFIISFIPLYFFLKKKKPDFLIVHLLTSIPLLLNNFFNLNTKIVLRISGLPRLNFLRRFFWFLSNNKITYVTSPTVETKNRLQELKIFDSKKLLLLRDPVLDQTNFNYINKRNFLKKNKFLAIGRLTKQKNFSFLIKCFYEATLKYENITLTIAGEGELKEKLIKLIRSRNMQNKIKLVGFKKNINKLFFTHDCFILSSLWEDPGFVLIEAASHAIPILSSDCKSGPREISDNGKNMFLFKSNNKKDFLKKLDLFNKSKKFDLKTKSLNNIKYILKFSVKSHKKELTKILLRQKKRKLKI